MKSTYVCMLLLLGFLLIAPVAMGSADAPSISLKSLFDFGKNICSFWVNLFIEAFQTFGDQVSRLTFQALLTVALSTLSPLFFGYLTYRNRKKKTREESST